MDCAREAGSSSIIAFMCAVIPLLLLVYAIIGVGINLLFVNLSSSELSRTSWKVDAATLVLATDKNAALAREITAQSPFVTPAALTVTDTKVVLDTTQDNANVTAHPGAATSITQSAQRATITCQISYAVPTLLPVPGLNSPIINRDFKVVQALEQSVEVGA